MFGKKKKFNSARIDTLIGQGTVINGDLVFTGGLHVDGMINGRVIAEKNSSALLILSEFGSIEGDISVPNMVLNGEVIGDVVSTNRVELAPKSSISGSVYYNLIEMAIGAEVNGGLIHKPDAVLEQKALEDKTEWKEGDDAKSNGSDEIAQEAV